MSFYSEYSILYIALSLLVAFILSILYYRKTNLSRGKRNILITLRTFSIFSFLVLLFVSFVFLSKNITNKPANIFLIDKSLSMNLENRREELNKAIEKIKSIDNNKSINKYYIFADDIIKEIKLNEIAGLKTENNNTGSTNLAKSLNTIYKISGDDKISTINIISDGIINAGGNPLYARKDGDIMFNYFLIGDTTQKNDLSIKNIYFNPKSFTESNTQILAEFKSYNFNKIVKINLYEDDNLIQEKSVNVNNENTDYNTSFSVKSNSTGIKKYKIQLVKEPDEITDKNNTEEFFIEYLDNKFKVLVISGNPSPDFSYLTESLKRINNFESKIFTQKSPGVFYEGSLPGLEEFNALILVNYPNSSTDINSVTGLSEKLKINNLPVFFIAGSNTDYEKLKILNEFIPFSAINKSGSDEKSPVKIINDLPQEINNIFSLKNNTSSLPDIFIPGIDFSYASEIQTILYSSKISKPLLFFTKMKDRNSAALLGYNFYKWKLNSGYNENNDFLVNILSGIILTISDKEKSKSIYINTDKQVYSPSEPIKINGYVNTEKITGTYSVKLQVFNDSLTKDIETSKTSDRNFSGEIKGLPEGEYNIKGALIQNGTEVAYDITKIIIKETDLEFKETKSENNILASLSQNSGGLNLKDSKTDEINKKIELKNESDISNQKSENKFFLNSSLFILILVILLLSFEWYMRKRLNLP